MTALEQKLLDELELLEIERTKEQQRLRNLAESFKKSIAEVSNSLGLEYQSSLKELLQSEDKEQSSLIAYLQTLSRQNSRIIELLKKPPTGDSFKDVLEDALSAFSTNLINSLRKSNKQLIEQMKNSLEE